MATLAWRSTAVLLALVPLAGCSTGDRSDQGIPAGEEFWICLSDPDSVGDYNAVVDAAMIERPDGRGRDLIDEVARVRVDRQQGLVQFWIDGGTAHSRDQLEDHLLDLVEVADVQRTAGQPFGGCGVRSTGS